MLYVWDSLDQRQCNPIDRAVMKFLLTYPARYERQGHDNTEYRPGRLEKPMKATLERLLLNLGDQQLLFSLALLLTIYLRLVELDSLAAYSFKMATSSVWLTCITHMSAVVALRHRFPPDGVGRGWRIAAMIVLLVLLAPLLVLSNLPSFIFDPSLSFRCAWDQISTYDRGMTRDFGILAASVLITTVGGYGHRILSVYRPVRRRRWIKLRWKRKMERRIRHTERQGLSPARRDLSWQSWRRVQLQLFFGLQESFLWQVLWLVFYLTFGITSLIFSWSLVPPRDQWSVSFGQLVPLATILFIIPSAYDEFQSTIFC
jgi:hypothetical protein